MRSLITLLMCACFAATVLAQSPYGDGFAAADAEKYLEGAKTLKAESVGFGARKGATGKMCMDLRGGVAVTFKSVSVDPDIKYTLSFRGSFTGGESIEENPRLELALIPERNANSQRYDFLPRMKMAFLDAAGQTVSVKNHSALPFREWHDYSVTFYPPVDAVSMQLLISSGTSSTAFYLDNARFGKTPDQGALNVNPVTSESGLYDYSAWESFAAGAGLIRDENGNIGFNTGYGSTGARFPLKEKTEYVILPVKADVLGGARSWQVYFLNKDNRRIGSISASDTRDTRFPTPAGCVSGVIFMRSTVLHEVRVLEAK